MATIPGYVLARGIRSDRRAFIFPYHKLQHMSIGRTRKVKLTRRPFIRTIKPQYPDYILAAFADVANIS